jgi:hypothetical protein
MNSIIDERKIKIDDSNNDELIYKDFENHEVNSVKNQIPQSLLERYNIKSSLEENHDVDENNSMEISTSNNNSNNNEEGILDSGASLAITNRKTLKRYNIKEEFYNVPFYIKFANNTRYLVTSFGNFGKILGNIAIVDEAPRTLISIYWLTDRGYSVEFRKKEMK